MTMETAADALLDRRPEIDELEGRSPRWRLSTSQRKLTLAAHVVISVGLFGVYAAMLILGIAGATAADPEVSGAAYRAMSILKTAVPPGAIGVVLTGVILALGTTWGLFKHLWIVVKLVLTVAALPISILLVFPSLQQAIAAQTSEPAPLVLVAATGFVALSLGAATVIAVYKPWGPVARRRQNPQQLPA
jgi:hypothetical protein